DDLDDETVGLLEEREPEIDRDAARLLLGQPVGVGPGEGFHQRRLAVIDVARGADDDVSHPASYRVARRAASAGTSDGRMVRQSSSRRSSSRRPSTGGPPPRRASANAAAGA